MLALVVLVVLLVVPLVPVVPDVPALPVVPEPCGDLKALTPGAPLEPSPPQAAVISVTDAQSVAPIKMRVPRESAMLSVYLFQKQRKVPRPPGRDGTPNAGRRRNHRRPAKSRMANTAPRAEKKPMESRPLTRSAHRTSGLAGRRDSFPDERMRFARRRRNSRPPANPLTEWQPDASRVGPR
ncbi:hypothetical protein [Burkholderia thailandensis]|uniref:hypothetical protein n=2 Tax=Burkholderia thailandensis TaxID=57975 RepID=UPI001D101E5A|nr:hypothetical protein [Burkholderia thailandensis]MCS6471950.1 hypothetical protein [Burkholderia thailandensis]MCS6517714.1 hypothetical protein [Burkholderia thailandensis]WRS65101.1 hypothetical protein U9S59_13795 [Burkholderia thailandensis]